MGEFQQVRVEGIRELQAALRATGDGMQKQLRLAGNESVQIIIRDARRAAHAQGKGPAWASESLRAASQQRYAAIKLGDARHPGALGWEFGALHDIPRPRRARGSADASPFQARYDAAKSQRKRYSLFRLRAHLGAPGTYRGFNEFRQHAGKDGFWLFPTIRRDIDVVSDTYLDRIEDLARAQDLL